jgi:hypothetical protein
MKHLFTTLSGFYNLICYVLALAAMAYLTRQLISSLQVDAFGTLPHVGLWCAGLLFGLLIHITRKNPFISLLPLSGFAGLVLIF